MATSKQVSKRLEKSFGNWDYKKAIRLSDNEAKTRDYLIEPFFNWLGYNKMEHYSHEYSVRSSTGSVQKVDMVITLNGRTPIMLVECKKATAKLTKDHFQQLSEYYDNHKESKVGILTNGIVYQFYAVKWNDSKKLNDAPFLVFDLKDFTSADLYDLAKFHKTLFEVEDILEFSEKEYFENDFSAGLTKTLHPVGGDLIKLVYRNMGGKNVTGKVSERLSELINSISLQNSVDEIRVLEGRQSASGVHTTPEELKAYQIVKTMLVMNPRLREHSERFGYKDYKGSFKIIMDEMPTKKAVCSFVLSSTPKSITIGDSYFELEEVSTRELSKYKKKLVHAALQYI